MNSDNGNLFLAIQQRLEEQKNTEDKRYFAQITADMQQLNHDQPPVKFPAALIGGFAFDYKQGADLVRFGDGDITIKVCFTPYSDVSNFKDIDFREKGLAYFNLAQIVYLALHGWRPSYIVNDVDVLARVGRLMGVRERPLPRNDDIIVYELTFNIAKDDYSAKPVKGTAPRPDVNISYL